MDDRLHLVADLRAKPGQAAALREVLAGLVAPSRTDPGCESYELHVDTADPGHFVLTEIWTTRDLWQAHMATPHLAAFQGRTDALVAGWSLLELQRL